MENRSDRRSEDHPTADLWSQAWPLQGLLYFFTKHLEKAPAVHMHATVAGAKGKRKETLSASSSRRGLFSPRTGCCLLVKQQGLAMWLEGCGDVQTNGCMDFSGSPVCSCSLFPRDPTADPSLQNSANKGLGRRDSGH